MDSLNLWVVAAALAAAGSSAATLVGACGPRSSSLDAAVSASSAPASPAASAAVGGKAPTPAQGPTAGRDVFRARCAACHGAEGRGDGPAAAALNPRPTNFADPSSRMAKADSAVVGVIKNGRRAMPAFARMLSPAQIDSVAAYVKTLSH